MEGSDVADGATATDGGPDGTWPDGHAVDRREERRASFGAAAGSYEAGRPGYSAATVDTVLDYAASGSEGRDVQVLEVGAGTGKATVALATRGLAVTCLEPDPLMAAVLRRNTQSYPRVVVRESTLEEHAGLDGTFGLVLAAQSWHWIDPGRRLDLTRSALRDGGALALLWNSTLVEPGDLRDELRAVHLAHDAEEEGAHTLRDPFPAPDDVWETTPPGRDLTVDPRFGDLRVQTLLVEYSFSARRYLDYLDSLSRYRLLPAERRSALLADIARVVEACGGCFSVTTYELAMLARVEG